MSDLFRICPTGNAMVHRDDRAREIEEEKEGMRSFGATDEEIEEHFEEA